jgi:hypothetical protein
MMAKWQVKKVSSSQNVELKKCEIEKVDKMSSQQNVILTRRQVGKPKS